MRNGSVRSLRLIAAAVSLAASNAWAADSGFYFGINAGLSDFDAGSNFGRREAVLAQRPLSSGGNPGVFLIPGTIVIPPGGVAFVSLLATSSTDVDQRDFAFSAAVGYTFNRFLSVELSYADLGELSSSNVTSIQVLNPMVVAMPSSIRTTQELSAETLAISVLGTLPLSERWSLFARGGYGYSESDLDIQFAFSQPTMQTSRIRQDFDSEDYVLGAGVGFKLSTRWSLRADYERLFEAGAERIDVDRFGFSAIYRL